MKAASKFQGKLVAPNIKIPVVSLPTPAVSIRN